MRWNVCLNYPSSHIWLQLCIHIGVSVWVWVSECVCIRKLHNQNCMQKKTKRIQIESAPKINEMNCSHGISLRIHPFHLIYDDIWWPCVNQLGVKFPTCLYLLNIFDKNRWLFYWFCFLCVLVLLFCFHKIIWKFGRCYSSCCCVYICSKCANALVCRCLCVPLSMLSIDKLNWCWA